MRAATVVQFLQDLFCVLLHVLFYLWSLLYYRSGNKNENKQASTQRAQNSARWPSWILSKSHMSCRRSYFCMVARYVGLSYLVLTVLTLDLSSVNSEMLNRCWTSVTNFMKSQRTNLLGGVVVRALDLRSTDRRFDRGVARNLFFFGGV